MNSHPGWSSSSGLQSSKDTPRARQNATTPVRLLIGSYTETSVRYSPESGIQTSCFDLPDGSLEPAATLAAARNPSFLALADQLGCVYSVNETTTFEGGAGGGITAYRLEAGAEGLTVLNSRPSHGELPCHLAVSPSERHLVATNYQDGVVSVYPIRPDGSLGESSSVVRHAGTGSDPDRQASPHPHMALFDPKTGDLLVPDLGADAVFVYSLGHDGILRERADRIIQLPAGSGPRHAVFSPDEDILFINNELTSTVAVAERSSTGFRIIGRCSTLPEGFDKSNYTAAIKVAASGKFVLVTNRGMDSIAVLKFDRQSKSLTLLGTEPTGGREPRDLAVSPDGRHVVVANQDDDELASFAFDTLSGRLTQISRCSAETPTCVAFV
ncbi:lactonase family protein [Arthrobacter sp. AG258]|uniref:lactonase family protein n=1 Tax=Arthrobacter sp. AG258 TaxID=2183899 RepID=UPI001414CDDF|nr:lactonase family protein [Arthrobacter sp. AG258]